MREFFSVLAIPMITAMALLVSATLFDLRGPLVALTLNAFLISEVAGFSQAVRLPAAPWYFRLRAIDREWVYEALGIRPFKQLMRSRLYRRVNPHFRLSGGKGSLDELLGVMRFAEGAHALAFMVAAVFAAAAVGMGWFDLAAWLMLFNVLLNAYPVMLQRYNRIRLDRVLAHARR
jgi:hypothetical protein